jgi:HEAT repeat protein
MPGEQQVCSHCGQEVSSCDEKAFTEKLLQALSHPEPLTQMRAVYLLGEKKTTEAVGALAQLYKRSKNPFLQGEIIEAMSKIGGEPVVSLLMEALDHRSFIVRGEAVRSLTKRSQKCCYQKRPRPGPQRPKLLCPPNRKGIR